MKCHSVFMRSRSLPTAFLEPKITVIRRKLTANVDEISPVENSITQSTAGKKFSTSFSAPGYS